MNERRKMIRRKADRELFELIERKTGQKPAELLGRRKRRRVIRHICKGKFVAEPGQKLPTGSPAEPNQLELECRVLDLTEGGAMVFADYELSVGWNCRFAIKLMDSEDGVIEATAEVRWMQYKDAKRGYAMGLQLSNMDQANQQRLAAFLANLDSTLGL